MFRCATARCARPSRERFPRCPRRRGGRSRRCGAGRVVRHRSRGAVRRADGLVVGRASAAGDGFVDLDGPPVLSVTAQIAIADTASIVLLPLVIDPDARPTGGARRTGHRGVRAGAVLGAAYRRPRGVRKRLHHYSEERRFALELRISLLMLFALCALATSTHVSIMLAGFALGLVVAGIGTPRRLARQLFGITEGFFGPLFFVWLGASLQVRELGRAPGFHSAGHRPGSWCGACALRCADAGPAADTGGVVGSTTGCLRRRGDPGYPAASARRRRAVGVDARRPSDDRLVVDRGGDRG